MAAHLHPPKERGYQFQTPSGSFLMRGDIARACIIMHDPREGATSLRPAACCCPAALPSNRKFLHLSHQSASATDPTTAPARCWLMPTRRCLFWILKKYVKRAKFGLLQPLSRPPPLPWPGSTALPDADIAAPKYGNHFRFKAKRRTLVATAAPRNDQHFQLQQRNAGHYLLCRPHGLEHSPSRSPSSYCLSLSALSARLQLISTLSNLSLSTVSCLGIHLIFMRSKMLRPRSPPNMVHIHFAVTVCAPSFFTNSLREQRRLFIIFLFIARRAGCTFPRPLPLSLSLFTPFASLSLTLPTPVSFMCFMKFFA